METSHIFSVVQLEKKVFGQTLGETFLLEELTNNPLADYFVYELNQQIIGYIGLRIDLEHAEVMNFLIDPNYQHQGYGQEIITFMIQRLKTKQVKTLVLEVRRTNQKARDFYLKNGFIKSHIRKGYYDNHEDAIVYLKEL